MLASEAVPAQNSTASTKPKVTRSDLGHREQQCAGGEIGIEQTNHAVAAVTLSASFFGFLLGFAGGVVAAVVALVTDVQHGRFVEDHAQKLVPLDGLERFVQNLAVGVSLREPRPARRRTTARAK